MYSREKIKYIRALKKGLVYTYFVGYQGEVRHISTSVGITMWSEGPPWFLTFDIPF